MEFSYNLNEFIDSDLITKIDSNLLPQHFSGDRRCSVQCAAVIHEILDEMGAASAKAQGLLKPITSGEKLRNSDHIVYLLMEQNRGKKIVVALLKIGPKNLFVYDEGGHVHEIKAICILDFYVHESKQRMGHGKVLYDYMLEDIAVLPHDLAIDKPSEKFLSFLCKHYGLTKIIPQTNNFVLFDRFFDKINKVHSQRVKSPEEDENNLRYETESNHNYIDRHSLFDNQHGLSKYGRHAAYKHTSSIGQCMSWGPKDNSACLPVLTSTNGNCEHIDLKYHHSQLW